MTHAATTRQRCLLVVTTVAACARTVWLLAPRPTFEDTREYQRLASWLVERHLFSNDGVVASSYRPPLYPAVIAAMEMLTPHAIPSLLIVQIVLGTLTVTLTALIAFAEFGAIAAWTAGLLLALAPMTAHFSTVVLTETVFTFLVVAGVYAWTRSRPAPAGFAFGLAALTRASMLPYVVALAISGLVGPRRRWRREALVVSVAAMVTVLPWATRNVIQLHRFTIADAGWGGNLFYGTVDLRKGSNRWAQLVEAQRQVSADLTAGSGESNAARVALSRIVRDPVAWLRIRAEQWPWLLIDTGDYLPVSANAVSFGTALATRRLSTIALKLGFVAGNLVVLCLAAAGAWSCRGRLTEMLPLWSFPVYLMAAHLPVFVEPRYGLPLVPFIAIFAGRGVQRFAGPSVGATESRYTDAS